MVIATIAQVSVLMLAGLVDDAVTRPHLERMLDDGDDILLVETFRRHPGKALAFIDGYLEGGLKMIEDGESAESARTSFRTGVRFAQLATQAFDDNIFERYAANFASWSPQEQKNFRLGQQEHGRGRDADTDPVKALAHYTRSYEFAGALGDTWGRAMASGGMARMYQAQKKFLESIKYGRESAELYRRLHLVKSELPMLVLCGDVLEELDARRGGLKDYHRAWLLVQDRPKDDRMRGQILEKYLQTLENAGQEQAVAELRASEFGAKPADDGPS